MHRRSLPCFAFAVLCGTPITLAAQSFRVTGEVTDSIHRTPLSDATVLATPVAPTRDTAFHATRTDAQGRFVIEGLQSGRYVVSVEHSFTDSIGLGVPSREVEATSEGTPPLALAIPSVATLRRTLCRAAESDSTLGAMLGAVRRSDGGAVGGATVVFVWTEIAADRANPVARATRLTASVTADASGVYRACGLPVGTALLVQAQSGAREQSGVVEERIGEAGVLVRELILGDTARAATLASGADTNGVHGAGVLRGVVLSRAKPVVNAQVHLFGTSRAATTNERGEFRLADIPTGTQGFEIVALGYMPRRFRAEVTPDAPAVQVSMSTASIVLDSVRVVARRNYNGDRYREFDERSHRPIGRYITEEQIERRHPFMTTDLFHQVRGFGIVVGKDGQQSLAENRGVTTLQGSLSSNAREGVRVIAAGAGSGGSMCVTVYVDGVRTDPDHLDELPPSSIHGIEIYHQGEAPVKYGALCGAILIWTK